MAELPTWQIPLTRPPEILAAGVHTVPVRRPVVPLHHSHWGLGMIHGHGELVIRDSGVRIALRPNQAVLMPPGIVLLIDRYDNWMQEHVDFIIPAPAVGGDESAMRPIAAAIDLGEQFGRLDAMAVEIVRHVAVEPLRSAAVMWHLLWELSACTSHLIGKHPDRLHPAVKRASEIIELRMGSHLTAENLAAGVDVAYSTLNRLFRQQMGRPLLSYLRHRRARRAQHLLQNTTLPVKAIAAQIGVTDLQHFNKMIRRELGMSPREVRRLSPDSTN